MPKDWIKRQSCAAHRMPCRLSSGLRKCQANSAANLVARHRRPSVPVVCMRGRAAYAALSANRGSPREPASVTSARRRPLAGWEPSAGRRRLAPRGRRNTTVQKPAAALRRPLRVWLRAIAVTPSNSRGLGCPRDSEARRNSAARRPLRVWLQAIAAMPGNSRRLGYPKGSVAWRNSVDRKSFRLLLRPIAESA